MVQWKNGRVITAEGPITGRDCGEGADLQHLLVASCKPFIARLVLDLGELRRRQPDGEVCGQQIFWMGGERGVASGSFGSEGWAVLGEGG